jgi:hypothetical protein
MYGCGKIACLVTVALVGSIVGSTCLPTDAAELYIGGATVSITPDQPVALSGQMHTRISQQVDSPVTATVLALESRDGAKVLDQAIMVSCDLVAIRDGVLDRVRQRVSQRISDLDVNKLFLSATHTHTGPVMREAAYKLPDEGVMRPNEYLDYLADQVATAIDRAWSSRRPGTVGWGLGYAQVALNRRSVYADGRAQMYGATNLSDFRGLEGYEDHGVEVLCFWDENDRLFATAINVACPAQEVESKSAVDADFWHHVRQQLREKHGDQLLVLGWTGASGDQSPHLMIRKQAEERMRKLRGLTRLEDIARRIVFAWDEAFEGARQERNADVPLVHKVQQIELPLREVTEQEVAAVKKRIEALAKDPDNQRRVGWHQRVVDRFQQQQSGTAEPYRMELHVIRLGDIAIATNDFELYTDFGIQIKARSPALQTFVIQLAGPGSYVPSQRAVEGGGYSAIVESNQVGPEGGQALADRTVELLKTLWPDS